MDGAASDQKASAAISAFWKATSKSLNRTLQTTFENVEKLVEQQEAEAFLEGAWQDDIPAAASYSDEASGRIDGSLPSLQSGEGNIPLHLKLRLAQAAWQLLANSFKKKKQYQLRSVSLVQQQMTSSFESVS